MTPPPVPLKLAGMITLHDFLPSGNGFKCRLMLRFLGLPFRLVEHDILAGETRTGDFLARLNPNGRIPVLELEDGTCLAESGAILFYLAEGSPFLPDGGQSGRLGRADVLRWMFFEQYSLEPNIAVRRFWLTELPEMTELQKAQLPGKLEQGYAALDVLERGLAGRDWLVGDGPTIADIALYGYTHVAPEGGYDLAPYPAVGAWIERFRAIPGYVPITHRDFS